MVRGWVCGVLGAVILSTFVSNAEYPDTFPTAGITLSVGGDTSFEKYEVQFTLDIDNDGTGPSICGYDVHLGLTNTDMTGPRVSFNTTTVSTEVTMFVRRFESTPSAPLYSVTTSDVDGDGNQEQTVAFVGPNPITDESSNDVYFVNVFPRNCEANPATNPTPTSSSITDLYLPHYAPLIDSSDDPSSHGSFTFADTNQATQVYSGTITIFTEPEEEEKFGVSGYVIYSASSCTSFPGCPTSAPADARVFAQNGEGQWTATLSDFLNAGPNNFVFIAPTNPQGLGLERQIKLVDQREPIVVDTDLLERTAALVAIHTPEKSIYSSTGAQIDLNVADPFSIGVETSTLEGSLSANDVLSYTWQLKSASDSDFRTLTTAPNANQIDISQITGNRNAGTYRVIINLRDSALTSVAPFFTADFISETLKVNVNSAPQRPETGVPINIEFTDTEVQAGFISGVISWDESVNTDYVADARRFEYYLIHLGQQAGCTAPDFTPVIAERNDLLGSCTSLGRGSADVRLGVVRYSPGSKSFTITRVPVSGTKFIHITAFEAAGTGAESSMTLSLQVADVQQAAAAPIPLSTPGPEFVDNTGSARVISGRIFFQLDDGTDYSGVEKFEVYQYHSAVFTNIEDLEAFNPNGPIASFLTPANPTVDWSTGTIFSMFLGTFNNQYDPAVGGDTGSDPGVTFNLDFSDGTHLDYLVIISRTPSNIVNGQEIGFVPSTTGVSVFVQDRIDSYYFVNHVASFTGSCPDNVCPSGSGDSTTRYWPYAEPAAEVDGSVVIYWVTASLTNLLIEISESGHARDLLHNTALDNMDDIFEYSVMLGSDSDSEICQLNSNLPQNGISGWVQQLDLTQRTLFFTTANYRNLAACGFKRTSGLALNGVVSLYLRSKNGRSDSPGSAASSSDPQLVVQADLTVTFNDETHASVANVFVENVVVVDAISTSVDVSSAIRLYEDAFLGTLDVTTTVFRSRQDVFNVEHFLLSNEDDFLMNLQRAWFSPGSRVTDPIELLLPQTSAAYTNVDVPSLPGRYRFSITVPILLNCKPCFMHLVSDLTLNSRKKAIDSAVAPKTTRGGTVPIYVDVGHVLRSEEDSASSLTAPLLGAVTALVLSRF